ncbi:alpha-amylase family glycosyl hydrolase [Tateyamaria armeniaca]|uniref:Alpha-amylase family glycosyl hydrolase n=1 Tax=Tateyamaria armeniaca TaxID=2518930 RepID=A0ABW8UTC3_9RHOB
MATRARPGITNQQLFDLRWKRGHKDLIGPMARLFGAQHEVEELSERLRHMLLRHWKQRSASLRALDLERDLNPDWFLSEEMVGYIFYIDKFAGRLANVPAHIPYLQSLGVTYVHMMPCLKPREGANDGGYAVQDYREINPTLGTMADFQQTTMMLRAAGMSTCIDMVLNHTAKDHDWALKAQAGDPFYQAFYRMFDDDTLPKLYERTLTEIFPDQAPGNFTYYPDMGKWVWTTFNEYQWDLNWENPEVLLAVLDTILFLANKGVEVFRLDAVAFMGKQMGTNCQNLPVVHDLLQLITQATRVAAPAVIHKAEAIVGPADLVPYLGTGSHAGRESQLAYHNSLMVQYWSALASQDTRLMTHVLRSHFPESMRRACFATYIRCHDDIGWAITEEDAAHIPHLNAPSHRNYLADFYNGSFAGSFARGADFQSNPETGDRRTNGSFASLAGLESALEQCDATAVDLALDRIALGFALIASFGGIPLIYMGDELGLLNDHRFLDDPEQADDGRWMQRPAMDWTQTADDNATTPSARLLARVRHVMQRRKGTARLASYVPTRVLEAPDNGVFAFARLGDTGTLTCVANFAAGARYASLSGLGIDGQPELHDLLSEMQVPVEAGRITLTPYQMLWISAD